MVLALKLEGVDEVIAALEKEFPRNRSAIEGALYHEAQRILKDSVKNTPKDTGALRASAFAKPPTGDDTSVVLGYGAQHAIPVHERTELRHTKGEAKFLQRAVDRASKDLMERVADRVRKLHKARKGISGVRQKFPKAPKPFGTDK